MKIVRKTLVLIVCFLFPTKISFWFLNLLGHRVHPKTKIGFSLIWIDEVLSLKKYARIGSFNYIKTTSLYIGSDGQIGNFNKLNGPIDVYLEETAAIGNNNKCYRAPTGVSYGRARLKIGILSKITAHHRIDCIRNVIIGDYSILAGHESQLWTHGYYHDKSGPGRFRLDGDIEIGNNVYIGTRCVITGGVKIADAVIVGANSCVSKSLLKPGTYVSQPLRYLESDEDPRSRFNKVVGFSLCEEVYQRPPFASNNERISS